MTGNSPIGKRIISSKILLLISLFILVFFSINLARVLINKKDLDKQVADLQLQIDSLQAGNNKLNSLIDYFKTNDFVESEARTKLNLRKEGEQIMIVPEDSSQQNLNSQPIASFSDQITQGSNPQKWLQYFFSQN